MSPTPACAPICTAIWKPYAGLRAAPLQTFRPTGPDTLVEQAVALARHTDPLYLHGNSPLWLQTDTPGSAWDVAREQLLRRLNERRELLRARLQRPLLLVLPENFLARAAQLAPDLWSIRQAAALFGAATIAGTVLAAARHLAAAQPDTPETVRDLSISLNKVGDVASARGPWDQAAAALPEAQTGWARLSAAFPEHEEFRQQAARLAEMLTTLGNPPTGAL